MSAVPITGSPPTLIKLPQSIPLPPVHKSFLERSVTLIACVIGIYSFFLTYGVIQERIYSRKYGDEPFRHAWFLVLIQISVNALFAAALTAFVPSFLASQTPALSSSAQPSSVALSKGAPPFSTYLKLAMSYVFAMLFSNWALSYMSYPAQSLAKACKIIPVMLMRTVIVQAKYDWRDYVQVGLVTVGISVFMIAAQEPTPQKDVVTFSTSSMLAGLCLCIIALSLDGYTGPTQERVYKEFDCSMTDMMLQINVFAIMIVAAILIVTGQLDDGVQFVYDNPSFLNEAILFSLCSALGQAVVLYTLLTFNSLVLVTITTTRKFVTIVLSIVLNGHELTFIQWSGVLLVFTGLALDIQRAYLNHLANYKSTNSALSTAALTAASDHIADNDDDETLKPLTSSSGSGGRTPTESTFDREQNHKDNNENENINRSATDPLLIYAAKNE